MLKKLELENFTVFGKKAEINLSPKINIIIGENGTGKSHILKAGYSLCRIPETLEKGSEAAIKQYYRENITQSLNNVFMPKDMKVSRLRRTGADDNAEIKAIVTGDRTITCSFSSNSQQVAISECNGFENYSYNPTFIPTKEVLSMMEGFISLYEQYHLSFDISYRDISSLLDLPKAREERLQDKSKWAMEEIEKLIGGKFLFHGGGRVSFQSNTEEYSVNAMAEGFRKAGMLYRLLETGVLQPGTSGTLYWDEPEANLNPKLMRLLVSILLELSRNGQQIIIATHDYSLLKWFDLLSDESENDHIRYHSLIRQGDQTCVSSTDTYLDIEQNATIEAFDEINRSQALKRLNGSL